MQANFDLPICVSFTCEGDKCHAVAQATTPLGVFCAHAEVSQAQAVALFDKWRAGLRVPEAAAAGFAAGFGGAAPQWHLNMAALLRRLPSFARLSAGDQGQALAGIEWMAQVMADAERYGKDLGHTHQNLVNALHASPFWTGKFSPADLQHLHNGIGGGFADASKIAAPSGGILGINIPNPAKLAADVAGQVAHTAARAGALLHDGAHIALGVVEGQANAIGQLGQLKQLAAIGNTAAKTALSAVEKAATLPRDVLHGIVHNPISEIARAGLEKVAGTLHTAAPWAAMVVAFVPGIGTGAAAAIAAADALSRGVPITDVMIEAGRAAVPGGLAAQYAYDVGVRLAKGGRLDHAAIDSMLSRLPPEGKAALQAGLAIAQGQNVQKAAGGAILRNVAIHAPKVGVIARPIYDYAGGHAPAAAAAGAYDAPGLHWPMRGVDYSGRAVYLEGLQEVRDRANLQKRKEYAGGLLVVGTGAIDNAGVHVPMRGADYSGRAAYLDGIAQVANPINLAKRKEYAGGLIAVGTGCV